MAVQVRQSKTGSATTARAQQAAAARLSETGLRPDDTIRFRKHGAKTSWITGRPLDIHTDGSVSCFAGGMLRAIRPQQIEVKTTGPRGGIQWIPLNL